MASGNATFKTPDQPTPVKKRSAEATSTMNSMYPDLPDLTPPPKKSYNDAFAAIGPAGASPGGAGFGFPRLVGSSPEPYRHHDGKSDSGLDGLAFRSTPMKGRSTIPDLSSPRSSLFAMNPPPLPIFHPSPRRSSDPAFLSPENTRRTSTASEFANFAFSPAHNQFASPGGGGNGVSGGAFTSSFAAILGDGHSRISPTNLSAAAAAARDGSVRDPFRALFSTHQAGAATDPPTGHAGAGEGTAQQGMVPLGDASPLQLDGGANGNAGDGSDGSGRLSRPIRRRALDFGPSGVSGQGTLAGVDSQPNLLAHLPQSPQLPATLDCLDALLPIPQLRSAGPEGTQASGQGNGAAGGNAGGATSMAGEGGSMLFGGMDALARSPMSMRPGIIRREDIIDSPAVKEATDVAVAKALHANVLAAAERRPARAAAAGAAAAAAAAAAAVGPVSRRASTNGSGQDRAGVNRDMFAAVDIPGVTAFGAPGATRCNCKKSRCLKLYCECFKAQGYCGEGCSCVGCSNREDTAQTVVDAREAILARNPQAFVEKVVPGAVVAAGEVPGGGLQHRRGCNCKKSRCLKKYCECFQAGIACGDHCKCEGCHNNTDAAATNRARNRAAAAAAAAVVADGAQAAAGGPAVNEAQRPLAVAASGTAPVGASPAFAALGPAFQQILLQAATANGGNGAASAQQAVQQASAMALLQKVLPTGALQRGQGGAAPAAAGGALTTRDGQLLVPIAWPLPGGGSSTQLLNLPPGALQALAAQMANAQPGAAVAAAPAAPGGGAHPAAAGGVSGGNGDFAGDGSPTPAVADGAAVPSSDDQSSGQGGEQGSDTSGADGAAPLSGRRKQPRVLQSGVDDGKEDPAPGSHRMTPSKRKPPRTMTAALM